MEKDFEELLKTILSKSGITDSVENILSQTLSELKSLDNMLAEIGRASGLTEQQLKQLGDSAFETASSYGKAAEEYLSAIQDMYGAGFQNARELADLSLLAQTAGGLDSSTAKEYLLAADAAYEFHGNAKELMAVLDGQHHISTQTTASMQDMAQATSEAAQTAAQCGIQVNELSALIAVAASESTQSGAEIGTALNTIFSNLRDTANIPVQNALKNVGISMTEISDGAVALKTPAALLGELSAAFESLGNNSTQKTNLLDSIGGGHSDTLTTLLENWSSYGNMLTLYSQGMGSASIEAENAANTLKGALTELSNTWTDTADNIADSDLLTGGVNTLNSLLSVINETTDALGSMGSIGLGAGLFAGFKNIGKCV